MFLSKWCDVLGPLEDLRFVSGINEQQLLRGTSGTLTVYREAAVRRKKDKKNWASVGDIIKSLQSY